MKSGKRGAEPVVPMPSATVTIVRDAPGGIEVLMMRRNLKSGFVPGMHVFPGGGVDETDFCFKNNELCKCLNDSAASGTLGLACDGLAYWAAAIREAFEESGLLLARRRSGETLSLSDAETARRFAEHRRRLNSGALAFPDLLQAEELQLAADQLTYFAHWITPVGLPRRYDTRFFMAQAPEGQEPLQDEQETIAAAWVRPGEALTRHRSGDFEMRTPTVRTLEDFADYDSVASLRRGLAARRDVRVQLPRIGPDGRRIMPGEPGYEEAGAAER
ncbi:MAG: NUDIX domain-containing protein [Burkholderiales bacterium]|nr:NUDIX domain-containing protein [Burkholderiales bacterium]